MDVEKKKTFSSPRKSSPNSRARALALAGEIPLAFHGGVGEAAPHQPLLGARLVTLLASGEEAVRGRAARRRAGRGVRPEKRLTEVDTPELGPPVVFFFFSSY